MLATTTGAKLEKLLNLPALLPDSSRSERVRKSKRRRSSPSSYRTAYHEPQYDSAKENSSYIPPTKIADIFAGMLSSKTLCELSAMKCGSPSAVRRIMPDASVDQICRMVNL